MCANTSDFQPEHVRVWPPPLFSKLTILQFWELFDYFFIVIFYGRECEWSPGIFLCVMPFLTHWWSQGSSKHLFLQVA